MPIVVWAPHGGVSSRSPEGPRQLAAFKDGVKPRMHLGQRGREREHPARDKEVVFAGERVPEDAVPGDGDFRDDACRRYLDATRGRPPAGEGAKEVRLGRDPKAADKGPSLAFEPLVAAGFRGADVHLEPEILQRVDPLDGASPAPGPPDGIVRLGTWAIDAHLEPHWLAGERLQRSKARAAEQHGVRQDRDGNASRGVADALRDIRQEERLTAREEQVVDPGGRSFVDELPVRGQAQGTPLGARAGTGAAVGALEVAIEIRVDPQAWGEVSVTRRGHAATVDAPARPAITTPLQGAADYFARMVPLQTETLPATSVIVHLASTRPVVELGMVTLKVEPSGPLVLFTTAPPVAV